MTLKPSDLLRAGQFAETVKSSQPLGTYATNLVYYALLTMFGKQPSKGEVKVFCAEEVLVR